MFEILKRRSSRNMRRFCASFVALPGPRPSIQAPETMIRKHGLRPPTWTPFCAKLFSVVPMEQKTVWGGVEASRVAVGPSETAEEERRSVEVEGGGGLVQPWQGARVRLNTWQQVAVAAGSAVGALMNPARADLVAALGETTGSVAFGKILVRMRTSVEGQKVLLDRPRVTSSSMARAWDLPPNTFGAAYAKFMGKRNFSPDDRPPVRFVESEDLAYVATRSREVHDFWHVLFNLPTSVMGELALKMVEFHQTGIPMCFLSVAGASWTLEPQQRNYLFTHYAPWALRAGGSASDLMCIYYEQHLHEDLDELRRKWGVLPAPPRPKK